MTTSRRWRNVGPATPDHIIRTKQFPMVGRDVDAFVEGYRSYFQRNVSQRRADGADAALTMLDPAPRVVLDPQLGLWTAGRRAVDCDIAADIYLHTIDVINAAEALGAYVALGEADLFDVEYWELEQAKLARAGGPGCAGRSGGAGNGCCLRHRTGRRRGAGSSGSGSGRDRHRPRCRARR